MRQLFLKQSVLNTDAQTAFDWHKRPDAFEQMTPPNINITVTNKTGDITQVGSRIHLTIVKHGLPVWWVARHVGYVEGVQFEDIQEKGPFSYWHHCHRVYPLSETTCLWEDRIAYELPFGLIADTLIGWWVLRDLEQLFEHRHQVLSQQWS